DKDEQVAGTRALRHTREQRKPEERENDGGPQLAQNRRTEERETEEGREEDVEPGDEARVRDGRALEARRLKPDSDGDEHPQHGARDEPVPAQPAKAPCRGRRKGGRAGQGGEGPKREEWRQTAQRH